MNTYMKAITNILLIAVLLVSMSASPASAARGYSDVPLSHEAAGPIKYLSDRKIISGFEDGTFRPDSKITRKEAERVIYNASIHLGIKYPLPAGKKAKVLKKRDRKTGKIRNVSLQERYPDRLIIDGKPPRLFYPKRNVTNAQLSGMISKAFVLPKATTKLQFTDVKAKSWYEQHIKDVVNAGIIKNKKVKYVPHHEMTRAELSTYIANAMLYTINQEEDPMDDSDEPIVPWDGILP